MVLTLTHQHKMLSKYLKTLELIQNKGDVLACCGGSGGSCGMGWGRGDRNKVLESNIYSTLCAVTAYCRKTSLVTFTDVIK